jgi:hypothetical protein
MIESGLFLPVQIDDLQSGTRNDEFVRMSPKESVAGRIKALKDE